ncbi:MAG: glycoside hydrolase [Ruminococcus sp.]|nr:glycoside hydrolase [Ruminococcus sp.]
MYQKLLNKAGAAIIAGAMAVNGVASLPTIIAAGSTKFEFEDATISGDVTVETDASASGGSYLKMTESGTIELTITMDTAGTYNLTVYAGGIGGDKQQGLAINGKSVGSLSIPSSSGYEAISVPGVKLEAGANTMTITKSWGWSNFDYVEVSTFDYPEIKATQTDLTDIKASDETRSLFAYLNSVYGEHILSGQQEIYQYGPHGLETEFEYLYNTTGHYPAIRGFDYGNFTCPAFGSDDGSTERVIDWVKNNNGIATASWHINVPKDMESYTIGSRIDWSQTTYAVKNDDGSEATNFVTSNAYKEGTKENEYYLQALTTLAAEFNKLEEEGVPVIWRPLHEAEGGGGENGSWFWWGKEGSAVYKELWKYTYKTLTEDFGCHNLIWEWNSYDFPTSANWYPGDEYVDIIGYDKYNCTKYLEENNWQPSMEHDDSAIASTFYSIMERYNSAKMVAMAENDCFSTVDNLVNDKAGWLYFCTWYDGGSDNINFLTNPIFNTEADTIAMYQSDYCITRDELPEDLYTKFVEPVDPALTTTKVTTASTPSTTTSAADFVFAVKKYPVTLPEGEKGTITLEIEGEPTASIGGGIGFADPDGENGWTNIEWSGNADAKGKLTVEVDLSAVPVEDTTAEVQIWWSNVWDNATESSTDYDCELVDYSFSTSAEPTTEPETDEPAEVTLYGDANVDGKVDLQDAVAILQYVALEAKYPLQPVGKANADVFENGSSGINGKDALVVMMVDAKTLAQSDLPVEAKDIE